MEERLSEGYIDGEWNIMIAFCRAGFSAVNIWLLLWGTATGAAPGEGPPTESEDDVAQCVAVVRTAFAAEGLDGVAVRIIWSLPKTELSPSEDESWREEESKPRAFFILVGEVMRERVGVESFRYEFRPDWSAPEDPCRQFVFERFLEPGDYWLNMELFDCRGRSLMKGKEPLAVPKLSAGETAAWSEAENEERLTYPLMTHSLRIKEVDRKNLLVGNLWVEAAATGEGIAAVEFWLNGKSVIRDKKPPYRVKLKLGDSPKIHVLSAVAFDGRDRQLARDSLRLNTGPHNFSVRVIEPVAGETYHGAFKARAVVEVPLDQKLSHVEFFLNDESVVVLYQEPFVVPMAVPPGGESFHLRVEAFLENGGRSDDLVLLNPPGLYKQFEVRQVELWVGVVDRAGRPILGLSAGDFTLFEDGKRVEIEHFRAVGAAPETVEKGKNPGSENRDYYEPGTSVPIHLVFLNDISLSMTASIPSIVEGTRAMIRSFVRRGDRAALMMFQDRPHLLVPFTDSIWKLDEGLQLLRREAEAAPPIGSGIYDSVAYALHYFGGIRGRRALLVFTDGFDNLSGFGLKQMMRYAKQAEVRVYVIAQSAENTPNALERLARESGGGYYIASGLRGLMMVLQRIDEELRSQYLLTYQTTVEGESSRDCRDIRVEIGRKKLKAKTVGSICP